MAELNYKKLQNGSDIRGVAMDGVDGERPNLTPVEGERLAKGFLAWLEKKTGKRAGEMKIAVGRDPRLTGEALLSAVVKGLVSCGVTVFDCGLASTPAMFMSTIFPEYACDGAVMITASHLPFNRNGFKFFDGEGGLNKGDISAIIRYAEEGREPAAKPAAGSEAGSEAEPAAGSEAGGLAAAERTGRAGWADGGSKAGDVKKADLMSVYSAFLRDKIKEGVAHPDNREKPLSGLKIAVDAGNGGGGFYARQVLAPLGADISASQFLEPDGRFPNHAPNPEDKAAMDAISQAVTRAKADFGLIFDTDVDRSSAVDRTGREINRNGIVAMAAALVAEEHPGTTVVTDSITSDQLTVFLEKKLGLRHLRFKRGYKNVINRAIELNREGVDSQLAIETSGHAALKENYFLDDGAYLATKIVIKAARLALEGKTLDSLLAGLEEPLEAVELRFPIKLEDFSAYGDGVLAELKEFAGEPGRGMAIVEPNYEGVRIAWDKEKGDGWCLLRKSLHDPIMPLNLESNREGGCREIAGVLREFLSRYEGLDISSLDRLAK